MMLKKRETSALKHQPTEIGCFEMCPPELKERVESQIKNMESMEEVKGSVAASEMREFVAYMIEQLERSQKTQNEQTKELNRSKERQEKQTKDLIRHYEVNQTTVDD